MPTTCQQILEAAYNRSSANDPGKLAEDAELIAHLNRIYDRFFTLLARARPDLYGDVVELDPLVGAPPSTDISDAPLDLLLVMNATGGRVHLIPAAERDLLWHHKPAVYRLADTLVSRGRTGDPIAGDVLTLTILPSAMALTSLASQLSPRFPARHHQLLIDSLALYLSTKDEGRGSEEHEKLAKEYAQATAAFAAEFAIAPDVLEAVPGSPTVPHAGREG